MTLRSPTIVVRRLVVKRNEHVAYDEPFHTGVNIIRGDNSSGKSTVMNFLFYGLGGDLHDWSDVALLCTHVWLEVELNGNPATLRRPITESSMSAMQIFGGRLGDAEAAPIEAWKSYPYRRSSNLENFSQAIFRLLDMPDVANEISGNVTIHQILRVLYADQLGQVDKIFRPESFDHATLRETVGNLLCGAYDNEVYESQQTLKDKEKQFESAASELRSILSLLAGGDEGVGTDWVEAKRRTLTAERESLLAEIALAEEAYSVNKESEQFSLSAQQEAYERTQELQSKLAEKTEAISALEFDIADSEAFIQGLQNKIESLRDAESVAGFVHSISFDTCPSCFADILEDEQSSACQLCKTPFDRERAKERIVGLINESAVQLNQSKKLQENRIDRLSSLKSERVEAHEKWKASARELQSLQGVPTSDSLQKVRTLHRKLGYLDREIDDLEEKLKLASRVDELRDRKASLNDEIERLKTKIDTLKSKQQSQLRRAHSAIERETIELLKNDLKRQDSFERPETVEFSFKDDKITVDGHTYFSASSRVILKSSFMMGFLAAALKDASFRHPKFLMIDITENNGMEIERSHNFQHQVMRISDESEVEHQIILATAFPSPELEEECLVGKYSTRDNRTLRIGN